MFEVTVIIFLLLILLVLIRQSKSPPKIIDYMFLLPDNNKVLGGLVRSMIKKGWQPIGGVKINHSGYYYQTMVKYE